VQIEPIDLPLANTQPGLVQWNEEDLLRDLTRTVRILPDRQMDGFYLCKLAKHQTTGPSRYRPHAGRKSRG